MPHWTLEHVEPLVEGRRTGFVFLSSESTPLDHHDFSRHVWRPP